MPTVVYLDILIIINFAVDYFLLRVTDLVLKRGAKLTRMLISAAVGSLFSLYIFLPEGSYFTELAVKAAACLVLDFLCFGYESFKSFIRTGAVLFFSTVCFGGICLAVFTAAKPPNMLVNNSVVYFDISPVLLVLGAVGFYGASLLFKVIFGRKNAHAEMCEVTLGMLDKAVTVSGIVDTGNSLFDLLGGGAVVIIDKKTADKLLGERKEAFKNRYRVIPYKTVGGESLLPAYRIDFAEVKRGNRIKKLPKPVAAISQVGISENTAIVNPEDLL